MSVAVKLSSSFVDVARKFAEVYKRSVPKQIEYWAAIGKVAEENPDLSYKFIKDIMLGQAEIEGGKFEEYKLKK